MIGVGHLGQHHARILSTLLDVQLVGIADTNESRSQEIAEAYHTQSYKDYHELIGKVDGITVVVPTSAHYDVGKDFLQKGIHTLIEKPITDSLNEAAELVSMAREHNAILQIGHVERFNAAVLKLRELLKEPRFIESHRLSPFDPRVRDVGVVLDLMIHDIDILLTVVQSEIERIEAVGVSVLTKYEDIANARIVFKNGCIANLTASRIAKDKMRKIRLFQDDAYFSLDYAKPELEVYQKVLQEGQIKITHATVGTGSHEPLKLELESFIQSIRQGIPPVVSGEHGHDALEVALEITRQIKK